MKVGDKTKNYCVACYRTTFHTILTFKKVNGSEDYHQSDYYTIVECDGCKNVSYRTEYVDYEQMVEDDNGNWMPHTSYDLYPNVLKYHKTLSDTYYLPKEINLLYREAINAFASECYLLTAVAFRALIEAICKDKSITGNDLSVKINKLAKKGLITQKESARLHAIRFKGNDSIHEMEVPKPTQLMIILKTVEHLLNNIYIIDNEVNKNLETIIDDYKSFEKLLRFKISEFKIGESLSLKKILGKSIRRLNDSFSLFEKELQNKVKSGEFTKVSIDTLVETPNSQREKLQQYTIMDNVIDTEHYC